MSIPMLAAALAGVCVGGASAQVVKRPVLQPVDPDYGDVGPLRVSTRLLPVDMRSPSGFDRVYRVPGSGGGVSGMDSGEERFARISGGLAAVFPRSDYLMTKKGRYALIPPGTIFYIGGVPSAPARGEVDRPSPARGGLISTSASQAASAVYSSRVGADGVQAWGGGPVDLRVPEGGDREVLNAAARMRADRAVPPQNVLADDQYRRARMRQLLWAAAHAE